MRQVGRVTLIIMSTPRFHCRISHPASSSVLPIIRCVKKPNPSTPRNRLDSVHSDREPCVSQDLVKPVLKSRVRATAACYNLICPFGCRRLNEVGKTVLGVNRCAGPSAVPRGRPGVLPQRIVIVVGDDRDRQPLNFVERQYKGGLPSQGSPASGRTCLPRSRGSPSGSSPPPPAGIPPARP